jgi:hypothetical protein
MRIRDTHMQIRLYRVVATTIRDNTNIILAHYVFNFRNNFNRIALFAHNCQTRDATAVPRVHVLYCFVLIISTSNSKAHVLTQCFISFDP